MKWYYIHDVKVSFIRVSKDARAEWTDELDGEPYEHYCRIKDCWENLMKREEERR